MEVHEVGSGEHGRGAKGDEAIHVCFQAHARTYMTDARTGTINFCYPTHVNEWTSLRTFYLQQCSAVDGALPLANRMIT